MPSDNRFRATETALNVGNGNVNLNFTIPNPTVITEILVAREDVRLSFPSLGLTDISGKLLRHVPISFYITSGSMIVQLRRPGNPGGPQNVEVRILGYED